MIYMATASGGRAREAITSGRLGQMVSPGGGSPPLPGAVWAADNGAFSSVREFDVDRWWRWLARLTATADLTRCLFAVAPDVVADAAATWERSAPWLPRIRGLGIPAAYVAQDGLTVATCPWGAFDVLFIGGSTDWKLGTVAESLIAAAVQRGVPVHVGRVNSRRRYFRFAHQGVTSCDGTKLAFGVDANLQDLHDWTERHATHPPLW